MNHLSGYQVLVNDKDLKLNLLHSFPAKWKTGWCKNSAGIKQESGIIDLGPSIRWHEEGWKKVTEDLCLKYCKLQLGATGCEFLPGTCFAHTKDVVSASGAIQDYKGKCYILPIGFTYTFFAATAAQEAHVSVGLSVCLCARNLVDIATLQVFVVN